MDPRGNDRPGAWTRANRAAEAVEEHTHLAHYRQYGDNNIRPMPMNTEPEILKDAARFLRDHDAVVHRFIVPYIRSTQ